VYTVDCGILWKDGRSQFPGLYHRDRQNRMREFGCTKGESGNIGGGSQSKGEEDIASWGQCLGGGIKKRSKRGLKAWDRDGCDVLKENFWSEKFEKGGGGVKRTGTEQFLGGGVKEGI